MKMKATGSVLLANPWLLTTTVA